MQSHDDQTPTLEAASHVPFIRKASAWVMLGAAVALVVVGVAMPDYAMRLTGFAFAALIAAWSLRALNRGRGRQAAQLMVYGVWTATTLSAVLNGGLASPAIAVPPVTVLLAGWLLGTRSALSLAALSLFAYLLMGVGAAAGLLRPPPLPPTAWLMLVHTLVLGVASALAATLSRGFAARLDESRRLSSSLEARLADIASRDRVLAARNLLHNALLDSQSAAGIGLFIVANGRVAFANPAACLIYGRDEAAMLAIPHFIELVHPDDQQRVLLNHQRRLAGENFGNRYDIAIVTAAGERRQVEITASRMADAEQLAVLVVMVDVTERKRAEAALRLSEQRFRSMAEQSADWVWSMNLALEHTYTNRRVAASLGRSDQGMATIDHSELLHAQDLPLFYRTFEQAVRQRRGWLNVKLRWRHADGSLRVFESSATPVFDAAGELCGFQGIDRDITERSEAERALAESRARFMDLVNTTDGIVWEADAQTLAYSFVSHKAERLLGYPVADWYQPGFWAAHLHADDREQALAYCAACTARLEPHQFEYRFVASDGREVWLHDIVTVVAEDGRPKLLRGLMVDITDRKAAESRLREANDRLEERVAAKTAELREALRELEAFTYSASHDLRTPLRGIEGFSTLLLMDYEEQLDAQGRDYLRRIRRGAQRLAHLIDGMLDLSRLTRREIAKSGTDLSVVAANVIEELRLREPLPLTVVSIAPGMRARCDAELMRSVLTNLIDNAWKFTRGTAAPVIEVGFSTTPAGRVYHVRDNGAGFDMKHADKLFQPFHRLHGPGEFEGSGIGLASVARIIHRHGGRVWAEAAPGAGASFYFTLGD